VAPKDSAQVRTFTEMVAGKQGWKLNPNPEFYGNLVDGLGVNWNRYGYFLCPCRDSEGSREADAKTICPCAWARSDIERHGHCYCALYLSPAFAESGAEPAGIPDGRYSKA
jgi:ferredoxin-thioredoxin reductase catalytic subunit